MGWSRSTSASGQTEAEFALVVAGVAIACIVAVLFLGGAVGGLWDRSTKPVTPSTFDPPEPSVGRGADEHAGLRWHWLDKLPAVRHPAGLFDFVAGLSP